MSALRPPMKTASQQFQALINTGLEAVTYLRALEQEEQALGLPETAAMTAAIHNRLTAALDAFLKPTSTTGATNP